MTEAMPFLQKAILLSYDPRPLRAGAFWQYEKGVFQRLRYSEFSFSFRFSHSTSQGCSSYSLR